MVQSRILQVLASLDRGGAETMLMNIYRKIDRTKIQFDFVVNERENEYSYEEEIRNLGGRIYYVPRYTVSNYNIYKLSWKRLLQEHPEWKVIHGHHTTPAFIYLKVAQRLNRITIAHSHIAGGDNSVKSLVKLAARYPIRYIADYLFACSDWAGKWMFGKQSSKTQVIKNAIEVKDFVFNKEIRNEKRKEFGIEDKYVIGHIGRFQLQKNHEFLIEVFNELSQINNKVVLMLIGDGELRKRIEKKVHDLKLSDRVIFTGVRSDVSQILQALDIFVFPSLYEGLPVTLVEAQAAGLPCVVSDTITDEVKITDLVNYVSLEESKQYWAERILELLNSQNRKNTSVEIGEAGYDLNESVKLLQSFYSSI